MTSRGGMSLRTSLGSARVDGHEGHTRLNLLGGFELQAGAGQVHLPPQVQRLLAFLALEGRPLHRAYVAGRLWIDLTHEHAHGCLRTTLWRMGRLPGPVVDVTSTHLALSPAVAVDARELEACTERVLHNGAAPESGDVDLLTQAAELLPGWYDDWVLDERERLRQLRLVALETAGEGLIGAQRYSDATIAALAAVASDPLRESAYRLLIRSYLGKGNVAEAVRQFAVFRERLRGKLDLEPSSQMQELLQEEHLSSLVDQALASATAKPVARRP